MMTETKPKIPTLADLKASREKAVNWVETYGESYFVGTRDAYDEAIALFEEMDQRLRELSEKWRMDADSAEPVGQSAELEAVLKEIVG